MDDQQGGHTGTPQAALAPEQPRLPYDGQGWGSPPELWDTEGARSAAHETHPGDGAVLGTADFATAQGAIAAADHVPTPVQAIRTIPIFSTPDSQGPRSAPGAESWPGSSDSAGRLQQVRALREQLNLAANSAASELGVWRQRLEERTFPPRALAPVPQRGSAVAPSWEQPWEGRAVTVSTRAARPRRRGDPRQQILLLTSLIVLASMLVSLLIPGLAAMAAFKDYSDLKALGESGVRHLLAAKDDLSGLSALAGKSKTASATSVPATTPTATTQPAASGGKASSLLDPKAFQAAQGEIQAAQGDFARLRDRLDRPDWVLASASSVPDLQGKLASARALADVGYDASTIGVEVFGAALPLITRLHSATLSGQTDLLTQDDLNRIQKAASHAVDLLADIQAKLGGVSFADLPLSAKQKSELATVMVALPQARAALAQGVQLLGSAGWLLGVGTPRHFLVQTLDRSELRPSGGFAGNYGVLTLANGKLEPFSLYNVNDIDYGLRTNGWIFGRRPPSTYSWWPFANWGLRDANLSADFPTTAKIVTDVFKQEGGGDVDGLIEISPVAISHVLLVTGPIFVPGYNDTVTAQNLEDKIHFYQQDPRGIAIEAKLNPDDHTHSLRKRFTQLVVQLLQDKAKQLPQSQLLPLAKQLLKDMQAKDIQLYFNNTQVEKLLEQVHATGAIDTTSGLDSFFLTQANTSVAKLTPYVQVTQHDDITLDDKGGATHHVALTFYNNPTGPIYGYPTYRNYVRIYVPQQARLRSANGFDTGVPLCWAPGPGGSTKPARFADVANCGANPYPDGALVCPRGQYGPGTMASTVFGSDGKTPWVLDRVGGPPATASDVPNHVMFGGYVVVPRLCTATVTLDYYVPGVVAPAANVAAGAGPYSLLIQRQGGTFYPETVTMHPSPKMAASGSGTMTYNLTISDNTGVTYGKKDPIPGPTLLGADSIAGLLDTLSGK